MTLNTPEPAPVANDAPATWALVVEEAIDRYHALIDPRWMLLINDMRERHEQGVAKYGTPLQPGNGRDSLKDAYQEVLDLCVYLKNAVIDDPRGDELDYQALYEDALDLALQVRVAIGRRDGR